MQYDGFQKSEQLPEDGQIRPKHVAIDVILVLLWIKDWLWTVWSCIKDGGEWVTVQFVAI